MEATLFVNTTTKVIRASLTAAGLPSVPVKFQTHLKLTVYFFAAGDAPALLDEDTTFNVTLKALSEAGGALFAQKVAPTSTLADGYVFEWAQIGNAALLAAIGDTVAGIESVLTIGWTIEGRVEKADMRVTIANSWQRADDELPEDTEALEAAFDARAIRHDETQTLTGAQRWQALANLGITFVHGGLRVVLENGDIVNVPLNSGEPIAP